MYIQYSVGICLDVSPPHTTTPFTLDLQTNTHMKPAAIAHASPAPSCFREGKGGGSVDFGDVIVLTSSRLTRGLGGDILFCSYNQLKLNNCLVTL